MAPSDPSPAHESAGHVRPGLRLLGRTEVLADAAVDAALSDTDRLVLGVLVTCSAGEVADTEALCALVWPDAPIERARGRLRTYVWRLRTAGAFDVLDLAVRGTRRGWLVSGATRTDLAVFLDAAAAALDAGPAMAADARRSLLDRAVRLWHGAPVPELRVGRALVPALVEAHAVHDALVLALADAQLSTTGQLSVVEDLVELARRVPGNASAWALAASGRQRQGRPAEAMNLVHEARTALGAEGVPVPQLLDDVEAHLLSADRRPVAAPALASDDGSDGAAGFFHGATLARLLAHWDTLPAGELHVHVMTAPSGSGASTIVAALAAAVRRGGALAVEPAEGGWRPVGAGGPARDGSLSTTPELFGRAGGRILVVDDRATPVGRLVHAVRELLAQPAAVTALVVRVVASPVVELAAVRRDMGRLVGAARVRTTTIAALDDSAMDALLSAELPDLAPNTRRWVVEQAAGNPGLAVALGSGAAGPFRPLPAHVLDRIGRRSAGAAPAGLRAVLAVTRPDGLVDLRKLLPTGPDGGWARTAGGSDVPVGPWPDPLAMDALDVLLADGLLAESDAGPRIVSDTVGDALRLLYEDGGDP